MHTPTHATGLQTLGTYDVSDARKRLQYRGSGLLLGQTTGRADPIDLFAEVVANSFDYATNEADLDSLNVAAFVEALEPYAVDRTASYFLETGTDGGRLSPEEVLESVVSYDYDPARMWQIKAYTIPLAIQYLAEKTGRASTSEYLNLSTGTGGGGGGEGGGGEGGFQAGGSWITYLAIGGAVLGLGAMLLTR